MYRILHLMESFFRGLEMFVSSSWTRWYAPFLRILLFKTATSPTKFRFWVFFAHILQCFYTEKKFFSHLFFSKFFCQKNLLKVQGSRRALRALRLPGLRCCCVRWGQSVGAFSLADYIQSRWNFAVFKQIFLTKKFWEKQMRKKLFFCIKTLWNMGKKHPKLELCRARSGLKEQYAQEWCIPSCSARRDEHF